MFLGSLGHEGNKHFSITAGEYTVFLCPDNTSYRPFFVKYFIKNALPNFFRGSKLFVLVHSGKEFCFNSILAVYACIGNACAQ